MNPDDFYKKFLADAEISAQDEAGVKRVLEVLRSEPATMSRAEPPAGYEDELLKNLARRMPAPKISAEPKRRQSDSRSWFFSPTFSWSLSATMAVVVAVVVIGFNRRSAFYSGNSTGSSAVSEADLLTQAAKKGPNRMVASWISSVGDSATQIRVAQADIASIAEEMARNQNPGVANDLLDAVAHQMGLRQ